MPSINGIRMTLYVGLWLFAVILFGLSAARIHYTTHLPVGDPLNNGQNFYDPIVAELLFSSILTILWVPFIVHIIHRSNDYGVVSTFAGEIISLSLFFLFWLVGAAIATSIWGDLSFCHQYSACRLLTALVAFAWMGWLVLFALLLISVLFSIANSSFRQPLHGRFDPRKSAFEGRV